VLRIYLDQKELSALAKGHADPAASRRFERLVSDGTITPVLSFAHVLETARWGNAIRRTELSDYVDQKLVTKTWLAQPNQLMKLEVAACFEEFLGGMPRPIDAFRPHFFEAYDPGQGLQDARREFSFAVDKILGEPRLGFRRIQRHASNWPVIRELGRQRRQGRPIPDHVNRAVMLQFVPTETPQHLPVGESVRQGFIDGLDLRKCQSTRLFFEVDNTIQADMDSHVDEGDAFDHFHIRAIPYCDMTTLDQRMHSYVVQTDAGKLYVDRIATNLPEALRKLGL
jgi:hypothetical protein